MANGLENQNLIEKLQKGTYAGTSGELLDYSYYDTWKMSTGDSKYDFFTVPINANGKDYSDTNFKLNGQMPLGHAFQVNEIQLFFKVNSQIGSGTGDISESLINNFLSESVLFFDISGKDYVGIWKLPEILGISTLYDSDGTFFPSRNVFSGKKKLQIPIYIASLTNFKITIQNFQSGGVVQGLNGSELTVSLIGLLAKVS